MTTRSDHTVRPPLRRLQALAGAALLTLLLLACQRADGTAAHVTIDAGGAGGAPGASAPAASAPTPAAAADVAEPAGADAVAAPPPDLTRPEDPIELALAYARCVRANGYPEWPDPNADGQFMMLRSAGMSFNDPRRLAAMDACQALRPPGLGTPGAGDAEAAEALYQLAVCMREHGVRDFPDPTPDGRFVVMQGPAGGFDPNSATFQAALRACATSMPGGMIR